MPRYLPMLYLIRDMLPFEDPMYSIDDRFDRFRLVIALKAMVISE